jgi:trehalose 6-phosphate synthase complex regulatory subunit
MHFAFPSSEIFRSLSVRESLLHGILATDLIRLQTARHFKQTVSRIMVYEASPTVIQIEADGGGSPSLSESASSKFVDVGVFAMGIDVAALREIRGIRRLRSGSRCLSNSVRG